MAQATTPTTRRPDRARRSVLDRLLGTSGAERLERYTRMSALSLFLLLPAIGVPACQGELRPVVHSKSASAGRDQERPR